MNLSNVNAAISFLIPRGFKIVLFLILCTVTFSLAFLQSTGVEANSIEGQITQGGDTQRVNNSNGSVTNVNFGSDGVTTHTFDEPDGSDDWSFYSCGCSCQCSIYDSGEDRRNCENGCNPVVYDDVPAPEIFCNAGYNQVTVSWPAVSGASDYRIRVNDPSNDYLAPCSTPFDGDENWNCGGVDLVDNDFDETSHSFTVEPGQGYRFWMSAVYVNGSRSDEVGINVACIPPPPPPDEPSGLVTTCQPDGTVDLDWNDANNATQYHVRLDDYSNNSSNCGGMIDGWFCPSSDDVIDNDVSNSHLRNLSLTPGNTYRFWVHSVNSDGDNQRFTAPVHSADFSCGPPEPPTCEPFDAIPANIDAGENSVLRWVTTGVTNATLTGPNGTQTVDPNGELAVSPDETFDYVLSVEGPGGTTSCEQPVFVSAPASTPEPPVLSAQCVGGDSIRVTWNPVAGAESYDIRHFDPTTGTETVVNNWGPGYPANPDTYIVQNVTPGEQYRFWAHSVNSNATPARSGVSANIVASCDASIPPGFGEPFKNGESCGADGQTVTLSWSSVPGAERYAVRLAPEGGGPATELIGEGKADDGLTALTSKFTDLISPGVRYDWWVHAIDDDTDEWSTHSRRSFVCNDTTGTLPAPPTYPVQCSPDNTSVTLSWGSVAGAESYPIRIANINSVDPEFRDDKVYDTTYTYYDIIPGITYEWWVHAYDADQPNESDRWSPSSSRVKFVCEDGSSNDITALCTPDGESVSLVWSSHPDAIGYQAKIQNGANTKTYSSTNSWLNNISIIPDTSYLWWVEALIN